MRPTLILILLFTATINASSQSDTPSNSFEEHYKKTNPTSNYKYDNKEQIHDYSNNWDFDKDGKPDNVYFVGTGGAHLYYFLRIVLSSDNVVRDFSFIQSDFPALPTDDELKEANFKPESNHTQFAVFDYNKDNNADIFVKLDKASFEVDKKILKKKGINTNLVIISFKDGKTFIRDLVDSN